MDQKIRFVSEVLTSTDSFSSLCDQFTISRKTGYKWVDRYKHYGLEGLVDRSRRPHSCPHRTADTIVSAILHTRSKHPTWGPKKLLKIVSDRHPQWQLPALSTTAAILNRHGMITDKKRRFRRKHPGCPQTKAHGPNDIWTADYKGHFKMKNGKYCFPLTVCDLHSRYLLGCEAHDRISLKKSKAYFTHLFKTYGLPKRIRTDNGVPFASSAIARLSTLSVWWIKLGIYPEQIEPGKPQQNGVHERMHRTLKKEATIPAGKNLHHQQQRFDAFRKEYNTVRPHEALDQSTPSSQYKPSQRIMPRRLRHFDYPSHFEVRKVSKNAGIRWKNVRIPVSHTLIGEYIAFEEIDNYIFNVYFCHVIIGRLFEEISRIKDVISRGPTRNRVTKNRYLCTKNKV